MNAPMIEVDASGVPLAPLSSNKASTEISVPTVGNSVQPGSRKSITIPKDKVRLDVLLVSGQRHFFDFEPNASAKAVREHIWSNWPEDWPSRAAASSAFKVLHLGHILDDKTTLSTAPGAGDKEAANSRRMSVGKTTVVHLLVRQQPLQDADDGDSIKKRKKKGGREATEEDDELQDVQTGCRCVIC